MQLKTDGTMEIKLNGSGKVKFTLPQKQWQGNHLMQTSMFAGEELVVISDDLEGYELHYLSFKSVAYSSIDEAKAAADDFAKHVLKTMIDSI